MAPPISYTWWQQVFPFLRGGWSAPKGDQVSDRYVDASTVTASTPVTWPAELAGVRVNTTPFPGREWGGSMGGIPMQRVDSATSPLRTWLANNAMTTGRPTKHTTPVPGSGVWVEGMPLNPGAWDCHAIFVDPATKESWELIGVNDLVSGCMAFGRFVSGRCVEGHAVCAGGVSMSSILLAPGDGPHRIGIAMTDYVSGDGSKPESSGWPRCGEVLRLSRAAYDRITATADTAQCVLAESLHVHGAVVYDHGDQHAPPGATLGFTQAGAGPHSWQGTTLDRLDIRFSDLERVTAVELNPSKEDHHEDALGSYARLDLPHSGRCLAPVPGL